MPSPTAVILLTEELCVASLLLLRRKSGRRYASRAHRRADERHRC